jgi:pimeloyl-ACP methyl ester carboxylesterase
MARVDLSAGTIEYEDTGGDGPVLLFQHGVAMAGSEWREVVADLRADHRCIVPELPLGAHRVPMRPDADLSFDGLVKLVIEFADALDLRDVTLVGNDFGLSVMVAAEQPARLSRLVLVACEAFDNCPPGLPGKNMMLLGRIPGGVGLMVQSLRIRPLRRLPIAYGWMSKRVSQDLLDEWLHPLFTQRAIRRDLKKFIHAGEPSLVATATERLRDFDHPTLVVWSREDRVMPRDHGRRLVELLPQGRLVEVDDSYVIMPVDRPDELARHIRSFATAPAPATAEALR